MIQNADEILQSGSTQVLVLCTYIECIEGHLWQELILPAIQLLHDLLVHHTVLLAVNDSHLTDTKQQTQHNMEKTTKNYRTELKGKILIILILVVTKVLSKSNNSIE